MDAEGGGRAKRQKIDRHGRISAFEKLKQLKGTKHKYEVDSLKNVYDTVDENEYTERVLQRQEEDWIDDDDGCGYVEDGREIFDDEEAAEMQPAAHTSKQQETHAKKRKAKVSAFANLAPLNEGKGNIRKLFNKMPVKKKEDVKLNDDSILSDLMSEINPAIEKSAKINNNIKQKSSNYVDTSEKDAQNYFKNLNSSNIKTKKPLMGGNTKTNKSGTSRSETEEKFIQIIDGFSPKKENKPDSRIAQMGDELEIPSQKIEEYNTQDLHFDGIDFDDDFGQDKTIKKENISIIADLIVTDFNDKCMDKSEIKTELKSQENEKSNVISAWSNPGQSDLPQPIILNEDSINLPVVAANDGNKVLHFYWWDAWEDRFNKPGVVFLFGKIYADGCNPSSGCVSCCIAVKNVERKLFLLPREYKLDPITLQEDPDCPVSMMDVYEEFNTKVATKLDLKEFKSRKSTKNYAFDLLDVPVQSEYLEVRYSAASPAPPTDVKYNTFSHIFGTNTSTLESFLLDRKLKGPCWLEIRNPESVSCKLSWCKVEANCLNPENIIVLRDKNRPSPPVTIATINMRTMTDPKTRHNTIVMISCLITNSYCVHKPAPNPNFNQHFCVLTKSSSDVWPMDFKLAISQFQGTKLTKCESERELLSYFLVQFWKCDPDVVLGHDLQGFQQDLLIGNIVDKSIPNWSRLGRLKRSVVPQRKFLAKDAFLGRLVCDIKLSSMELIRSRSYDLATLCTNVLKSQEGAVSDISADDLCKYYTSSRDLLELVLLTMQDTSYILRLMFELNVFPLALQITQIAGNVMSRTLMGGRSERNEYLLLHAFTEKEYIVPDKVLVKKAVSDDYINTLDMEVITANVSKKQVQARKKPAYSGGLVLDPKKGFYDSLILLMDFNSLYPSIIQEYNICFTTIKRNAITTTDEEISEMVLPDSSTEPGILPTQIRKLVESRREVKKLLKLPDLTPEQHMQYNIRQLALKLTANSMYGCLGFTHSRFYAKPLAALVTMKGREILINTKELVSKLNYDVIYGDTDSIMINTNCLDYDQVFKIGYEIKKEINKKYRQVELDIDGVFRYLLLLKKKKYAAVLINKNKSGEFTTTQELKGLDIVRRDWSQLAAEAGKFILNQILSEQSSDERVESIQMHLMKLRDDLRENKLPLSMLTITKQLTKNPNEYADKNGQPHVQVAMRINSKNGRRYKKGDIVPYIICEDGTTNSAVQRAYHVEELRSDDKFKVDINYYLAHQLHPVISRICDPIDGLDSARIADFLGLDPSSYKQTVKRDHEENLDILQIENEKTKYSQCEPFTFICVDEQCKFVNKIRDTFVEGHRDPVTFLDVCQNDKCTRRPIEYLPSIMNQLVAKLRNFNAKYYENWLICEDPACTNRTVRLPHYFIGGHPLCTLCEKGIMFREYTEKDLYTQITYFHYLFSIEKHNAKKSKLPPHILAGFHALKECVEDVLSHSAYSVINLSDLFSCFDVKKPDVKVKTEDNLEVIPSFELEELNLEMELNYD